MNAGVAAFAASAALGAYSSRRPQLLWLALRAAVPAAVLMIALSIALRWAQSGQGPFLTLYEVVLSSLFSLGLIFLLACTLVPTARHGAAVALPLLALLGLWALLLPADVIPLPPTFDNPWLWAHVAGGKLFLGTCLVAASLSARLLLAGGAGGVGADPALLDAQVWRFAAAAFVFDSLMLVAGAVWAHDAWGRYWAWDPLETWAFLTWLALGTVLHARLALRLGSRAGWALLCAVFVLAFLTFFGVPFVSLAPHKGVM